MLTVYSDDIYSSRHVDLNYSSIDYYQPLYDRHLYCYRSDFYYYDYIHDNAKTANCLCAVIERGYHDTLLSARQQQT